MQWPHLAVKLVVEKLYVTMVISVLSFIIYYVS